jgi:hypothetical protein
MELTVHACPTPGARRVTDGGNPWGVTASCSCVYCVWQQEQAALQAKWAACMRC